MLKPLPFLNRFIQVIKQEYRLNKYTKALNKEIKNLEKELWAIYPNMVKTDKGFYEQTTLHDTDELNADFKHRYTIHTYKRSSRISCEDIADGLDSYFLRISPERICNDLKVLLNQLVTGMGSHPIIIFRKLEAVVYKDNVTQDIVMTGVLRCRVLPKNAFDSNFDFSTLIRTSLY